MYIFYIIHWRYIRSIYGISVISLKVSVHGQNGHHHGALAFLDIFVTFTNDAL